MGESPVRIAAVHVRDLCDRLAPQPRRPRSNTAGTAVLLIRTACGGQVGAPGGHALPGEAGHNVGEERAKIGGSFPGRVK